MPQQKQSRPPFIYVDNSVKLVAGFLAAAALLGGTSYYIANNQPAFVDSASPVVAKAQAKIDAEIENESHAIGAQTLADARIDAAAQAKAEAQFSAALAQDAVSAQTANQSVAAAPYANSSISFYGTTDAIPPGASDNPNCQSKWARLYAPPDYTLGKDSVGNTVAYNGSFVLPENYRQIGIAAFSDAPADPARPYSVRQFVILCNAM